jgi:hypothetical protein
MIGATSGTGTAHLSGASENTNNDPQNTTYKIKD